MTTLSAPAPGRYRLALDLSTMFTTAMPPDRLAAAVALALETQPAIVDRMLRTELLTRLDDLVAEAQLVARVLGERQLTPRQALARIAPQLTPSERAALADPRVADDLVAWLAEGMAIHIDHATLTTRAPGTNGAMS